MPVSRKWPVSFNFERARYRKRIRPNNKRKSENATETKETKGTKYKSRVLGNLSACMACDATTNVTSHTHTHNNCQCCYPAVPLIHLDSMLVQPCTCFVCVECKYDIHDTTHSDNPLLYGGCGLCHYICHTACSVSRFDMQVCSMCAIKIDQGLSYFIVSGDSKISAANNRNKLIINKVDLV